MNRKTITLFHCCSLAANVLEKLPVSLEVACQPPGLAATDSKVMYYTDSKKMLQIAQSSEYNQSLQFCKAGTFLSWILQQTSAAALWLFFIVNAYLRDYYSYISCRLPFLWNFSFIEHCSLRISSQQIESFIHERVWEKCYYPGFSSVQLHFLLLLKQKAKPEAFVSSHHRHCYVCGAVNFFSFGTSQGKVLCQCH